MRIIYFCKVHKNLLITFIFIFNHDIIIKEIVGDIITDITYFKDKFKRLEFRVFDDENKMQEFLERVYNSENVVNSLINDRLAELEDKLEWLKTQNYYENEKNYVIEFYNSLMGIRIKNLSQLEDVSKKIDKLMYQFEQVYNQVLRKVHRFKEASVLQDTINYIQSDKNANLTEEEKSTIESYKKKLELIASSNDFKPEDVENISQYFNNISLKLFEQHQTDPKNFVNGESFVFTVHNLTSYTDLKINDEFYRKNFISTSLITDKEMGLYGSNKVGFIYPVDGNIVAADSKDVYSYNTKDNDSQIFIGKFDKPTIKPPIQIEQECMKKTIEKTGEILNYSKNSNVYSEVVLDIKNMKPTGVFCVTNGEKELNPNYVEAMRLSKEFNLPLVDIDMSIYRVKNGLAPITEDNKIQLATDMLYMYYKGLDQNVDYGDRLKIAQIHSEKISEMLMTLKSDGQYSIEAMTNVLNNILSNNYDYSFSEGPTR
jgi:hypothetical protein